MAVFTGFHSRMAILAYGVNYRTAPIDLRERIAFPEDALGSALTEITQSVPSLSEAAIISTCNRTELYCTLDPVEEPLLQAWLANHRAVPEHELASAAYTYWDQAGKLFTGKDPFLEGLYQPPGYPYVLSLLANLTGRPELAVVRWSQAVLGMLSSVMLLALAGRPVCDQLTGDGVPTLAERT